MMRRGSILILALMIVAMLATLVVPVIASDPSGALTGSAADISAAKPGAPTLDEVANQVGKNKIGLNVVWTLLAGFMVFFMQAGFALVETGFTRAKNAVHTMTMNFVVFLIGAVGFWLVGFPLMMGGFGPLATFGGSSVLNGEFLVKGFGLFGTKGWGLMANGAYDVAVFTMFLFQMVFMDTTATIPTGAMAERVKFSAVVIMTFFISMFVYPIFGNWVWGGGWLAQLGLKLGLGHGAIDFSGSGVIHTIGGMAALAGALVLGPRIGKFRKDGTPNAIPGHDIPMAILGTIILFFGWFGFNPGSTLAGTDTRIAVAAVNTMIAGAVGGVVAMFYTWRKQGKPDASMICNGSLAGLVAITAPCAFVNPISAAIIGAVAGILVCVAVSVIENRFKIDDPVGAIAVHGVNGLWGVISLGLFADGTYGAGLNGVGAAEYLGQAGQGVTGLFYGDPRQFLMQLIFAATAIIWGFGVTYLFLKVMDATVGIRVKAEDELEGLDIPEMGMTAYPDFPVTEKLAGVLAARDGRRETPSGISEAPVPSTN